MGKLAYAPMANELAEKKRNKNEKEIQAYVITDSKLLYSFPEGCKLVGYWEHKSMRQNDLVSSPLFVGLPVWLILNNTVATLVDFEHNDLTAETEAAALTSTYVN
jgi:hypothetical protein